MSKNAIQAAGDRRWRLFSGVLAVLAIAIGMGFSLLGSQTARADVISLTCDDVNPPVAEPTSFNINTRVYCRAVSAAAVNPGSVVWTATGTGGTTVTIVSGASGAAADGTVAPAPTVSFIFDLTQATDGTASATGGVTVTVAFTDVLGPHPATQANQTQTLVTAAVTGAVGSAFNLAGTTGTATFALPAGFQCTSDVTAVDGGARTCALTDVSFAVTGSATATATGVTVTGVDTAAGTVTVTFMDSVGISGGTIRPQLRVYNAITGTAALNSFVVSTATAKTVGVAELRNMSDVANTVLADQEFNWNVRGSRHTICTVQQDTGIDGADADNLADDPAAVAVQIPAITLANIVITNGGGYVSTADTNPDFTDVRIFIGDGTATGSPNSTVTAGLLGATCISWVSTDAGDQQISLVYVGADGANYNVSWDTNDNNNGAPTNGETPSVNNALVKEWNRLEDSVITLTGGATGTATGNQLTPLLTRTINVTLNPATGLFQFTAVNLGDVFRGSHTNAAGVKEGPAALAGVLVTATISGCGVINGGTVAISGVTAIDAEGNIFLTDLNPADDPNISGNPDVLSFVFGAGGAGINCGPGQTATITFTGTEPGPLGSGTGVTVTEIVVFNFAQNIAEKKVFLAWAGQRIIFEHDWRIAAGDSPPFTTDGPTPNGTCPFGEFDDAFVVQYIKGTGPGNFVPGLNAIVDGADQAFVLVGASDNSQTLQTGPSADNDIIGDPQDNCISRVLYESEDPGEVDVEAFVVDTFGRIGPIGTTTALQQQVDAQQIPSGAVNSTKVAFVVYYMKINTISISLASQFEKPSHNNGTTLPDWTSGAAGARTAPVNPWNAALDDADNAVEWNVTKDILVRGRVTGWFTNSNPSGRAADTSNPLNVLPANRWVMPQDWPLLAGGPADPADGTDAIGTAEQFRPYYDLMFAPNNTRGIALANPEGTVATQLTFIAASSGIGTAGSPIRVTSCVGVNAGLTINVGATSVGTVTSCAGGVLIVGTPLAAAPAAGTGVFLASTVPFEGPYSTIDIVGLAAQGFGGAALSNFVVGNIRDTALGDGDVDWFDAPMPSTHVSVAIRGTGFLKEVLKDEVYYLGTPNNAALQIYTNPYYITNIPGSPFIPAVVAGGGYLWNSWGLDGPGGNGQGVYRFWQPVLIGTNSEGIGEGLSAADQLELGLIRTYTGDATIARDLVVYTDNHGEFMVAANGDFKTDLTACATNVLAGGRHCAPGDHVGTGTITATVDYPDFRGKHFPVLSNSARVTWTWGGYKDITVEDGETDFFKYIVFHAMDRDAFCSANNTGASLLHSVLGTNSARGMDDLDTAFTIANLGGSAAVTAGGRYNNDPVESVDFLIDSGEGIIIGSSGGTTNDGKQFATGVPTFSLVENDPAVTGLLEFPLSPLAAAGQTDECQAYIKVSNTLLGILDVLAIAHDDEGNIGFDEIIDLQDTMAYTLNFRWSLITWAGADNITVNDAIKGTGASGKNPGGNDISASVTAIYGWDAAAQQWLGFFPSGVNVPGANDLTVLRTGQAYWIAITGPSSVTWTIATDVD